MRTILSILLIAAVAAPAAAGVPDDDAHGPKSPGVALGLSTAATLGAAATIIAGAHFENNPTIVVGSALLVVGPAAGSAYSGKYLTRGTLIRAVGAGALLLGVYSYHGVRCETQTSCTATDNDGQAVALAVVGGAAMLFSVGLDLHDADRNARRYNRAHRALSIAPAVTPHTAGLALAGSF